MNVAELKGVWLDYWVARAEGKDALIYGDENDDVRGHYVALYADTSRAYAPSSFWEQGGPIIEREGIGLWKGYDSDSQGKKIVWEASDGSPVHAIEISGPMGKGPTPLVAAMRAYVRLKFGKEVEEVPQPAGD